MENNYIDNTLIKMYMKKIFTIALMTIIALSASTAKKKEAAKDANKPVFTIIKEIPITSVKDQNH